MTQFPAHMAFGDSALIVSPDGSGRVPIELQPDLAAIVLLEPEPEMLAAWIRRLELSLGVRDVHRAFVAGGLAAVQQAIHADRQARGLLGDDWSLRSPLDPFPGEAPPRAGHALAEPDDERRLVRRNAIRAGDQKLSWFIFRAASNQEHRAEANLIQAGYAVYCPRVTCWRRSGPARKVRRERSLFGGYMFVGVAAGQSIGQAIELDAVYDALRIGGIPRQVAFDPIAALVGQECEGEFDKTRSDRRKDPDPGTPVSLTSGMFKGWPARFIERREDERIAVMLTMLGKDTAYAVEPSEVDMPERKEAKA